MRAPARLSLLALLAVMSAHSITSALASTLAPEPVKDDPAWLERCQKEAGGMIGQEECMVDHLSALAGVQAKLVAHIDVLLAGKGEDGTDYKAAAAGLAEAQRHWRAFVEADCDIIGNVFGSGTAQGLASAGCWIDHYRQRNDELRELEADYLRN